MADGHSPDPDELLAKQPQRQRTLKLADVLSDRLDKLCALVNGDRTTPTTVYRYDLLAVLIANAPESVNELDALYSRYSAMKVREALVGAEKDAKVVELYPVKPGRRAR